MPPVIDASVFYNRGILVTGLSALLEYRSIARALPRCESTDWTASAVSDNEIVVLRDIQDKQVLPATLGRPLRNVCQSSEC